MLFLPDARAHSDVHQDLDGSDIVSDRLFFVLTIIQFYLLWPLLLKLFNKSTGVIYALLISLLWTTIVAMLGKSDVRVWNSFFLQYLWEFVLGMYLAKCYKLNAKIVNSLNFNILVPVCIICVALTGFAYFGALRV